MRPAPDQPTRPCPPRDQVVQLVTRIGTWALMVASIAAVVIKALETSDPRRGGSPPPA